MENENTIRTLGDYPRPSHEGYRNTIKLPDENIVVPLESDTIQLVQNEFSFYGLWFEDPNQHLKCESLSEAWTRFKDLLQKVAHHGHDLWLQVQIFYDHVNLATRRTIDQSAGGLVSNFMASQDARLSKFEADFKQQQGEMTSKIDTVLNAINN
ncbi:hypothetical protein Tco_0039571 [Tanacetum coccineum]